MLKQLAAGAAALVIMAGGAANAETPTQTGASPAAASGEHRFTEDRAAFLSARVAALHAGLQLTPEQDKAWPGFEKAYRDLAEVRGHRRFHAGDRESLDALQRAQRWADALAARSSALRHYADALAPLYQSLDDGQKRRFAMLQRFGHHRFHHFGFHGEHGFADRDGEHGEFHHGFHHGEFHHGDHDE